MISEIRSLHNQMCEMQIPHRMDRFGNRGWEITYPADGDPVCSIIQTDFSIGGRNGLLEICGLLTPAEEQKDSILGNLTADEVLVRIRQYERRKKP